MPSIAHFLDAQALDSIVRDLSETAGLPITIADPRGVTLTRSFPNVEFFRALQHADRPDDNPSPDDSALAASLRQSGRVERLSVAGGLTLIAAPILAQDGPLGAIVALEFPPGPPTDDQLAELARAFEVPINRLRTVSAKLPPRLPADRDQLVRLLRLVAGLLSQVCRKELSLRERIDDLNAIYSVAGLMASSTDLQQLLDTAAKQVQKVMRVRACSIRLIAPKTSELRISAVANLSETYLTKGPIRLDRNPIDQAALRGEIVYVEDMASDPRTLYPTQARAEGIVSCLVAGMLFAGEPIGVIRAYSDRRQTFSSFDGSLLRTLASQLASAIHNARLYEDARDAERHVHQLAHAGDVQRRMIPQRPPPSNRVELGCVYHPSLTLGGDFCDFIELPQQNIGVAIADVVGKGVAAALMMASVRSALRAHARSVFDIGQIMRLVNRALCRDTLLSEFATLFYGVFSSQEPVLTYCNAGHELPLLLRRGELVELESSGMAIGIDPEQEYHRHRLHLEPDDVFVFFTDGAFDATAYSGEFYGRDRLRDSVLRYAGEPAQRMARNIMMDIHRFIGLASQSDDVTLVVARWRGDK